MTSKGSSLYLSVSRPKVALCVKVHCDLLHYMCWCFVLDLLAECPQLRDAWQCPRHWTMALSNTLREYWSWNMAISEQFTLSYKHTKTTTENQIWFNQPTQPFDTKDRIGPISYRQTDCGQFEKCKEKFHSLWHFFYLLTNSHCGWQSLKLSTVDK